MVQAQCILDQDNPARVATWLATRRIWKGSEQNSSTIELQTKPELKRVLKFARVVPVYWMTFC